VADHETETGRVSTRRRGTGTPCRALACPVIRSCRRTSSRGWGPHVPTVDQRTW